MYFSRSLRTRFFERLIFRCGRSISMFSTAQTFRFDNRQSYYEVIVGRETHDYLICVATGKVIEFSSERLRNLRDDICREHGFARPISAQNQYYLWGHGSSDLSVLLAVGASQYALLRKYYGSVQQVAVYRDEYRWAAEGPTPIYLCTQPRADAETIWRGLRWYGA